MTELKLTIELVPSPLQEKSIYKICKENKKQKIWQKIKEDLFLQEGRKCYICEANNLRLEAHEFWNYDNKNHIQKLESIHHLCHLCHKIKHSGLWFATSEGLEWLKNQNLTTEDLINHFLKINDCTRKDFEQHYDDSFKIYTERSKYNWIQDFGIYKNLIK